MRTDLRVLKRLVLSFFLCAFIVVVIIPLLIFFALPWYVFRYILVKVTPYIRPDLGKIVHAPSQPFAIFQPFDSENSITTISVAELDNPSPNIEDLRHIVSTRILKKSEPGQPPLYPELKQTIVKFGGYLFWKNVENFDIQEHVVEYTGPEIRTEADVSQVSMALGRYTFWKKGRPLWKIILVKNVSTEYTSKPISMLALKMHHILADGLSLRQFMKRLSDNFEPEEPLPHFNKAKKEKSSHKELELNCCYLGTLERLLISVRKSVKFALKLPYELVDAYITQVHVPQLLLPLHKPKEVKPLGWFRCEPHISMEMLNKVKKIHGVDLTTVVLTMITGACRSMLQSKGYKVPKRIPIIFPVGLDTNRDKLRNMFSAAFIGLPIGEENLKQRMHKIHINMLKLRKAQSMLWFNKIIQQLFGMLPIITIPPRWSINRVQMLLTNAPGPKKPLHYMGSECVGVRFGINAPIDTTLVYVFIFSTYAEKAWISCAASNKYLDSFEDVKLLNKFCVKELEVLYADAAV